MEYSYFIQTTRFKFLEAWMETRDKREGVES